MLRSRFWFGNQDFGASVGAICIILRDLSVATGPGGVNPLHSRSNSGIEAGGVNPPSSNSDFRAGGVNPPPQQQLGFSGWGGLTPRSTSHVGKWIFEKVDFGRQDQSKQIDLEK